MCWVHAVHFLQLCLGPRAPASDADLETGTLGVAASPADSTAAMNVVMLESVPFAACRAAAMVGNDVLPAAPVLLPAAPALEFPAPAAAGAAPAVILLPSGQVTSPGAW
jgi:hypothetical protein